jgi:hypothetical protein
MLPFFGQPIVVNVFPQGCVLLEIYQDASFLAPRIDNELNTFHIHDLLPLILSSHDSLISCRLGSLGWGSRKSAMASRMFSSASCRVFP